MTRILLVEDERDLAEPVLDLLRRERYEVVWADDLASAYRALDELAFDLAVLDVMLPESENAGLELARNLRNLAFPGRILFLTAGDSLEDRIRGLGAAGDDYMVKPFSLYELLARIQALLRRSAQASQAAFTPGG